jgi:transposase
LKAAKKRQNAAFASKLSGVTTVKAKKYSCDMLRPCSAQALPILGQETHIAIRPRRAQCPTCLHNPTTTQELGWYEQRSPHTKAYDQYLMKQLIGSTVADVSLKEKVGYDALLGALQRQVASEVNWAEVQNLGTVGIDEVAHKKGRKSYRAVITARQDDGTVLILAVLNDRKKRR